MDSSAGDNSEKDSNVDEINQQHCTFAEEAFIYLLDHFGIRAKTRSRFRFFTDVTGRAVVTIAYAYRKRLRTLFRNIADDFADVDEFKKIAGNFELIQDECYFYRVLKRISHIFELVVFCLGEGHDHVESACKIDLFGDSTRYFEIAGGLNRLNKTAAFVASVGVVLYSVIKDEKPQDVILRSFVAVVGALEMPHGDSMPPVKRGLLSVIKKQVSNRFSDVHDLDVRVARVFYQVICQHTSKVIAVSRKSRIENMYWREKQYVSIEREKLAIIESLRVAIRIIFGKAEFFNLDPPINLAECFAALRHLTDLISPVLDGERAIQEHRTPAPLSEELRTCYSLRECFIVSGDYVTERERKLTAKSVEQNLMPESSHEQPSRRKLYRKGLRKIIDANIKQNNYFKLNDGRYVVHTPDCTFDHTTTTLLFG